MRYNKEINIYFLGTVLLSSIIFLAPYPMPNNYYILFFISGITLSTWVIYNKFFSIIKNIPFFVTLRINAGVYWPLIFLFTYRFLFPLRIYLNYSVLFILVISSIIILKIAQLFYVKDIDSIVLARADDNYRKLINIAAIIITFFLLYKPFIGGRLGEEIDLFHTGSYLATANDFLRGKVVFKEIALLYGIFKEIILPILGFKIFGVTLRSYLLLENFILFFHILCLFYLSKIIFKEKYFTFIFILFIIFFDYTKQSFNDRLLFGLAGALFIARYILKQKHVDLAIGSFFSISAFLYSFDVGSFIVLATLTTFIILKKQLISSSLKRYLFWLTIFSLPFFVYLIYRDNLRDYLYNFFIYRPAFYYLVSRVPFLTLSFEYPIKYFIEFPLIFLSFILPVTIVIICILYIISKYKIRKTCERRDLIILYFSIIQFFFYLKIFGLFDIDHIAYVSIFSWLLFFWLMEKICIFNLKNKHLVILLIFFSIYMGIFIFLDHKKIFPNYSKVFNYWKEQKIDTIDQDAMPQYQRKLIANMAREGLLFIKDNIRRVFGSINDLSYNLTVSSLERLAAELSSQENGCVESTIDFIQRNTGINDYIFDWTNQAGYYFLANRKNATRYYATWNLGLDWLENDCLKDLETNKPRLIIYKSKYGIYNIGQKIIYDYLNKNYEHTKTICETELYMLKK